MTAAEPGLTRSAARLELNAVSLRLGGTDVLRDVTFQVGAGEVHALLGENGAGKSTLLRVLAGETRPNSGRILVDGVAVQPGSVRAARRAGIALIHQELQLVPELTVTQNMFLGRPLTHAGALRGRAMRQRAVATLRRLDATIDPDQSVGELRLAGRQIVEIVRALLFDARIIAMDEPTTHLMPAEYERLVMLVEQLRKEGAAIIYVSHQIDEVRRICSRGTVIRGGCYVGTVNMTETTEDMVVDMMVGRTVRSLPPRSASVGPLLLEVRHLCWRDRFLDVSFGVHRGEVLGIAGVMGAGRTELMQVLAGIERPSAGEIWVRGRKTSPDTVRRTIRAGIGLLPEARSIDGVIPFRSVLANVALASLPRFGWRFSLGRKRLRQEASDILKSLGLHLPDLERPARSLGRGDQLKIVVARWLLARVEVLLLDDPTRGVDAGSRHEFYRMISELTQRGLAIVVTASELSELLQISDRVLVMRSGRVVAEFNRSELSESTILQFAARDGTFEGAA